MTRVVDSWSAQYRRRREIGARFGDIFSLPLVKRAGPLLARLAANAKTVLELGAGDRRKERQLKCRFPQLEYASLDVDSQGQHDYRDWAEVNRSFDLIFAFEVVEHIPLAQLPGWIREAAAHLNPGGFFLCTTPNVYYPPDYLRDITHCTPLCFDELGALIESAGLQVTSICRVYHDPLHRRLLKRYAFLWLFRMLGIDFARQIVVTARRGAETDRSVADQGGKQHLPVPSAA